MVNHCERFARILFKNSGIGYRNMVKKYPRAHQHSVWLPSSKTVEAHCVHCARVEAVSEFEQVKKMAKQVKRLI